MVIRCAEILPVRRTTVILGIADVILLDDVRFYSRVLSDKEIEAQYSVGVQSGQ